MKFFDFLSPRTRSVIQVLIFGCAIGLSASGALAQPQKKDHGTENRGSTAKYNNVIFGGYFEVEYEDINNKASEFDQNRTALYFGARPHERLRFFSELVVEHGGDDVRFEQSWLEFGLTQDQNFRGGIDLIPVGRRNLNHDGSLRDFVFRPYSSRRLIPTSWFESGVSLNGELSEFLTYRIGYSNGMRGADTVSALNTRTEFESMLADGALAGGDDNNAKAAWGRVALNPLLGTEIGVSVYTSEFATDRSISYRVLDLNSILGPLEVTGEYIQIDKDQETIGGTDGLEGADGGNVEAALHFFPGFLRKTFVADGFADPTFTLLVRHETLNYDEPAGAGDLDESYNSFGFNYRPIERMAFKASYDFENRVDPGAGSDTGEEDRAALGMALGF